MVATDNGESTVPGTSLSASRSRGGKVETILLRQGHHSISVKKEAHQYRVNVLKLLRASRRKLTHQASGVRRRSPRLASNKRGEQLVYWVSKERAVDIANNFRLCKLSKKIRNLA